MDVRGVDLDPPSPPPGYRFSQDFSIAPAGDSMWVTTRPMWFEIGGKGSVAWVTIPAGFVSDGPSIPAFGRLFFNSADARIMRASIVHDYLLSLPGFSPLVAAISFRDALLAGGISQWSARILFLAVAVWTTCRRRRL